MRLHAKTNGLIIGAAALAWAAACGSSNSAVSSKSDNCRVGSEGCPCTAGKGCDKGLVCYDPLCFKPGAEGSGGTGTGGQGGIDGLATGSISGVATGGIPNSGPDGAPGTGGATSNTGGSGGPDGSVGSGGSGGSDTPATCPFPTDDVTAHEQSDPKGSSKDQLKAKFSGGRLVELDSKTCTADVPVTPSGDWGSYPCRDGYSCGGCIVFVVSPTDAKALGNWWILGEYSATNGTSEGCPELSGVYQICVPDCDGKQCGDDGCGSFCGIGCGTGNCCNSADQCVADSCSRCLDACIGGCGSTPGCASSCCTGSGCACAGACPGPC